MRDNLDNGWRHSAALKLNGYVPRSHTKWIASYRWTSGQTLVPVDLFNASAGQTDPYFNLFVRQPLPHFHGMPGSIEAIIELRNLLAQGYVPWWVRTDQTCTWCDRPAASAAVGVHVLAFLDLDQKARHAMAGFFLQLREAGGGV